MNVLWPQRLIVDTKVIMPHWVYSNFSLILLLGDLVACADDGVIRNSKKTKRKWNMNALLPHISLLFSSWMNRATTQLIHWVWPILLNKKDSILFLENCSTSRQIGCTFHPPQLSQCLKITKNVPIMFFNIGIFNQFVSIFGIFHEFLFSQNVIVARFARNDEWDFFCDLQKHCAKIMNVQPKVEWWN